MNSSLYCLIVLLIGLSTVGLSQNRSNPDEQVEAIVRKYMDSLRIAGMSVSVIQAGEVEFKKSFGYANLELGVPMTNESVYRVWSISKQFCAVSILKLEAAGRLALSDPISKYLDSIPKTWEPISIQQLLSHTSGIKDYLNDFPAGKELNALEYEQVMDSTRVLKFAPGDKWSYSNTGYWVLSKIVEQVSGKPYHTYLNETLFVPLQMTHTQRNDYSSIIKHRVAGYKQVKGVTRNASRIWDEHYLATGDGELMSTIDDLTIWAKALFSGAIIERPQLEKMQYFARNNSGAKVNASWIIYYDDLASYGMGWFISELAAQKIAWTPGAGRGFSTTLFSVPDADLHIIVLCNARKFLVADSIARAIATELLNHK
jgi:D-alanyl-D-alanine carboxypeptidase